VRASSSAFWGGTNQFPSQNATTEIMSANRNGIKRHTRYMMEKNNKELTQVNKAKKDMSSYPVLEVATPMVETITRISSIP